MPSPPLPHSSPPPWQPQWVCLNDANASLKEKKVALTALGGMLSHASAAPLQPLFVDWLRQCEELPLLQQGVGLLSHLRLQASVSCLMDIALAIHCRCFEHPPQPYDEFLKQEAVIRLRCQAVKLLGHLGDGHTTLVLMELLNNKALNYRIRLEAAESLGRLRQPQALNPLIQVLKDEREHSHYLKESAAKALGLLGDIRAIEPMLELFESQQGFRKKCAFVMEQMLASLGKLIPLASEQDDVPQAMQRQAHAHLLKALTDEASSIRIAALEALGELDDARFLPDVQARLWDDHEEVAHTALAMVYKVGGLEAVRGLLDEPNLPHFLREEILDFLLMEAQEALKAESAQQEDVFEEEDEDEEPFLVVPDALPNWQGLPTQWLYANAEEGSDAPDAPQDKDSPHP